MQSGSFELEEERLEEEVRRRKAKRVILQLPDGLKREGLRLADAIERAGATAIISGDPCYGACDIALSTAVSVNADLIVHYGHTVMIKRTGVPVVYFQAHARVPVEGAVERAIELLKPWRRIGLATTAQHVDDLDVVKGLLTSAGKDVYIGDDCETLHPGQVLGCNYMNAKSISPRVEAFLFIGGGRFHPLGLALATMKPVISADPFEGRAYSLEDETRRVLRKRWAGIEEARKAKNYGVIIGLKPGQLRLEAAMRIREALRRMGKKAHLLALTEITPTSLGHFQPLEAYINTACPRVSLDDPSIFPRPVLTLKEAYVMLGMMRWEDLLAEGII
ncbi:MAG: diphthamide biosynthesis protein [Candidatus Bathyarchaeota archaeon B63]|nr:MAG: diphthamide biosynthesis protein [Candidatus Bathyarchaeota archaeon B63]